MLRARVCLPASAHASPSRHVPARRAPRREPRRVTACEMPPKSDAVVKDAFPEGLQRGDLVFAKIYGFPWWPAVVRGVRHAYEPEDGEEPTVRVRFCADPTNYHATPSTLERFADKPEWTDVKTVTWKFKSPTLRKKWEVRRGPNPSHSRSRSRSRNPNRSPGRCVPCAI